VEAVAVVATLLYLSHGLWQHLRQDGQEGEDGGPRHELGQLNNRKRVSCVVKSIADTS